MNNEKLMSAIDVVIDGLQQIKKSLIADTVENTPSTVEQKESSAAIDLLTTRVAYAYSTRHPEYKVDSLFEDLKTMVNGDKISFILSWMRKGNNEGIEGFLKLDKDQQRTLLQKVITIKETEIKEIFTKRFCHDS